MLARVNIHRPRLEVQANLAGPRTESDGLIIIQKLVSWSIDSSSSSEMELDTASISN